MSNSNVNLSSTLVLTINPRIHFTQFGVYLLEKPIFLKRIRHSEEEIKPFQIITDQYEYRKELIMKELRENDIEIEKISVILGRGGLVKPVKAGVYEVNEKLCTDLKNNLHGVDAVNIGGLVAYAIASEIKGAKAYIADPVVVDELDDLARIAGHPLFERRSVFHALNQKYVARKHAKSLGLGNDCSELNLIIVNLARGITVSAHKKGKVIDTTQGFDGDGPFSPVGSGTLPMGDLIRMCFSGKYTEEEMHSMIRGKGGMFAYFNKSRSHEIDSLIENGDKKVLFIVEAMAYQVSKSVGAMYMVFDEKVDAILIAGKFAHNKIITDFITKRVSKIAPVHIYSGDDVLGALAENAFRALKGETEILEYK